MEANIYNNKMFLCLKHIYNAPFNLIRVHASDWTDGCNTFIDRARFTQEHIFRYDPSRLSALSFRESSLLRSESSFFERIYTAIIVSDVSGICIVLQAYIYCTLSVAFMVRIGYCMHGYSSLSKANYLYTVMQEFAEVQHFRNMYSSIIIFNWPAFTSFRRDVQRYPI